MAVNPRYANRSLRIKYRNRFKAMDARCAICGKPIHYDEPSDWEHPWSFVIDEIHPISKYKEFGYSSPRQAAEDWNNLQAAHYYCNSAKSNKTMQEMARDRRRVKIQEAIVRDGNW